MPLNSKGQSILTSMQHTYGSSEKGKRVFYASINKGKIKGVEKGSDTTEGRARRRKEGKK